MGLVDSDKDRIHSDYEILCPYRTLGIVFVFKVDRDAKDSG